MNARYRRGLEHLQDSLFPPRCLVCGLSSLPRARTATGSICGPCLEELPWNVHACALCASPLQQASEECAACELAPPPWDRAIVPLRYAAPVDTLIRRLKFRANLADGRWLAGALAEAVRNDLAGEPWPSLLIAVPMHPWRRALRGFNHAAFLADALSQALPPSRAETKRLRRTRWTPAQAKLDAHARRHNLSGALHWRGGKPPRRVAVIDDVLTTGATAAAVTDVLHEAGAEEVQIWACARAGRLPKRRDSPAPDR